MERLRRLRAEVFEANVGIFRAGLVTMHSGNASGIDRERGRVLIKPSGVDYEKLSPGSLVMTDLQGRKIGADEQGDRMIPSVDLPIICISTAIVPTLGESCTRTLTTQRHLLYWRDRLPHT